MSDQNQFPDQNDVSDNIPEKDVEDDRQRIFAERFNKLTNEFGRQCDADNIHTAIAIAQYPDEAQPVVFMRGSLYDAACLLARVLRNIKEMMADELKT